MRRSLYLLLLLLLMPALGSAREAWRGWCEQGAKHVVTSGLTSTSTVQLSSGGCQVTVYVHGGALATLYADNNGTPKANPFTADTNGMWIWYADNNRYDVTTSSATLGTVTYSDILLCDPAIVGSACGSSGGVSSINIYKNNVLVGTEPGIDFVEGTNITVDPATDDPSNTRVHLQFNSVEQVALAGTLVGAEPRINFIQGSNVTLTVADNTGVTPPRVDVTIAASGGGGGSVCSTVAAGTKDIIPQTCAGEWTLQGLAGNPTSRNLTLLQASDQQAPNLFSGLAAGSFSNMAGGGTSLGDGITITNIFTNSWHLLNLLNGGAKTTVNAKGIESTLTVVNQDNAVGGENGIIAGHFICDNNTTGTAASNEQCIVAEAYNDNTSATLGGIGFMDAISIFATDASTAGNNNFNDVLSGLFVGSVESFNNNPLHGGIWISGQDACSPSGACAAWNADGITSFLSANGGKLWNSGIHNSSGIGIADQAICSDTGGTCSALGTHPTGAVQTIIAAGATTVAVTNVHPFNGNNPIVVIQEDPTLTGLGTCNTTMGRTYQPSAKASGLVVAAQLVIASAGTGYAVNDTGVLSGGNNDATYIVTSVSGGKVTGITLTAQGTGYTANDYYPVATANTIGTGAGLKFLINQTTGSFTIKASAAPVTNPACLSVIIVNDSFYKNFAP